MRESGSRSWRSSSLASRRSVSRDTPSWAARSRPQESQAREPRGFVHVPPPEPLEYPIVLATVVILRGTRPPLSSRYPRSLRPGERARCHVGSDGTNRRPRSVGPQDRRARAARSEALDGTPDRCRSGGDAGPRRRRMVPAARASARDRGDGRAHRQGRPSRPPECKRLRDAPAAGDHRRQDHGPRQRDLRRRGPARRAGPDPREAGRLRRARPPAVRSGRARRDRRHPGRPARQPRQRRARAATRRGAVGPQAGGRAEPRPGEDGRRQPARPHRSSRASR